MAEMDPKQRMAGMLGALEQDQADGKLAGLTVDDLADAMAHPKAKAVVGELMALEPRSAQAGAPAPDFTLPWLPGSEKRGVDALSLSSHFGKRPVALIFGSYT